MGLTKAEEEVMKHLWKLEKAYMKNILDEFPEPKPAPPTLATLLKRMTNKGYVGYNQHGVNREYFPSVKKSDYFAGHLNGLIKNFFNNSATQFSSFFTSEAGLSDKELCELKEMINKQLEKDKP